MNKKQVELGRADYEQVQRQAREQIRQGKIMQVNGEMMLEWSSKCLEVYLKENPDEPEVIVE